MVMILQLHGDQGLYSGDGFLLQQLLGSLIIKDPQMNTPKIVAQSERSIGPHDFPRDNATHADITKPDYIYTKLMTLKLDDLSCN
ncbi:hypothetical protein Tco_0866414 [Tanacetum coccineum]